MKLEKNHAEWNDPTPKDKYGYVFIYLWGIVVKSIIS